MLKLNKICHGLVYFEFDADEIDPASLVCSIDSSRQLDSYLAKDDGCIVFVPGKELFDNKIHEITVKRFGDILYSKKTRFMRYKKSLIRAGLAGVKDGVVYGFAVDEEMPSDNINFLVNIKKNNIGVYKTQSQVKDGISFFGRLIFDTKSLPALLPTDSFTIEVPTAGVLFDGTIAGLFCVPKIHFGQNYCTVKFDLNHPALRNESYSISISGKVYFCFDGVVTIPLGEIKFPLEQGVVRFNFMYDHVDIFDLDYSVALINCGDNSHYGVIGSPLLERLNDSNEISLPRSNFFDLHSNDILKVKNHAKKLGVLGPSDVSGERLLDWLIVSLEHSISLGLPDTAAGILEYIVENYEWCGSPARHAKLVHYASRLSVVLNRSEILISVLSRFSKGHEASDDLAVAQLFFSEDYTSNVMPGGRPFRQLIAKRKTINNAFSVTSKSESEAVEDLLLLACNPLSTDKTLSILWSRVLGREVNINRGKENILAFSFPDDCRFVTNGPLVSVVMSHFDSGEFLLSAVRSVLNQTYRNIELIVCDDSSGTQLNNVLSEFMHDKRLRIFSSINNHGTYNIRNGVHGFLNGEYVTYHDSDDISVPNRIEIQVKEFMSNPDLVCVYGNLVRITDDCAPVFFADQRATRMALPSMLLKKKTIDRMRMFHPFRISSDYDFFERLKLVYGTKCVKRINSVIMLFSVRGSSLTNFGDTKIDSFGSMSPKRKAVGQALSMGRLFNYDFQELIKLVPIEYVSSVYTLPAGCKELSK